MAITGLNYLGNETSGKSGISFRAKSPETMQDLDGVFHEASVDEVHDAVQKAEQASKRYQSKSPEEIALFLESIADEILALDKELVVRAMAESALPEGRITGERGRTMNQLKLFASVVREGSWVDARIDPADPNRVPNPRVDIRQMHVPLGPVGIFGASNFPLAFSVAGGDTVSALAAGCSVVVKGHPLHPGTSELVGQAILTAAKKTGMPEGVFSLVQGTSTAVGLAIVKHPMIKAIGFTGSYKGGKSIFDAANRREVPIPVYAEMGSTNPVFILPSALAEQGNTMPTAICNSVNLGVGQFCTNPGLIIAQEDVSLEKLKSDLAAEIKEITPSTMLGTGIKSNYQHGVDHLKSIEGVETLSVTSSVARGNQAASIVLATSGEIFLAHDDMEDEVFGPSTIIVSTKDKNEMLSIAKKLGGHLTATIFGSAQDLTEYQELVSILQTKVGRLIFNGYPTGVEVGHAMVHGGPFPATTGPQSTSVGSAAIKRFARPLCYQNFPHSHLPPALQDDNPLGIWRMINGELQK